MSEKKLRDIPVDLEEDKRWEAALNHAKLPFKDVVHFLLSSKNFGSVEYGLHPGGYATYWLREPGGGGPVVVPYSFTDQGRLLVGLIEENRPNMADHPVWCVVGGFLDPGESHEEAAERELQEETGLVADRLEFLGTFVDNRAFRVADVDEGEGIKAFALHFSFLALQEEENGVYRVDQEKIPNLPFNEKVKGKLEKLAFYPWREAADVFDGIALAAMYKLIAKKLP